VNCRCAAGTHFSRVEDDGAAMVYVRDIDYWHHDRFQSLRTDHRSPAYEVPPETLLRNIGVDAKNHTIDLKSLLDRLRFR